MGKEKRNVARKEANKLVKDGFIKKHTTPHGWKMWLWSKNRMVNGSLSGGFLSFTNRLVDGTVGHHILSFLDAYSGYNQIYMNPRDKEKTTFMTNCDKFYYEVMSFSLKNAGVTYQKLMNYIFKGMLNRNVEVYVVDIVVKSNSCLQHIKDLKEVFKALRDHGM